MDRKSLFNGGVLVAVGATVSALLVQRPLGAGSPQVCTAASVPTAELLAELAARARSGSVSRADSDLLCRVTQCPPQATAPPCAPTPCPTCPASPSPRSCPGAPLRTTLAGLQKVAGPALYPLTQIEMKGDVAAARHSDKARVTLITDRRSSNSTSALSKCTDIDVVYASRSRDRCLAVVDTSLGDQTPAFVERLRLRSGGKWVEKGREEGRGYFAAPRASGLSSGGFPSPGQQLRGLGYATRLLTRLRTIDESLKPMLSKIARPSCQGCAGLGQVTAMATNAGNVHLVLNWLCSARAAGVVPSNVIVFASDKTAEKRLQHAGLATFHDKGFGDLPEEAARQYGDGVFGQMMWLKTLAVFLPVHLGFTTLFQDADLVWFRNPWPTLDSYLQTGADTVWQDDGARSSRFAPYYANSGFFLVAGSPQGQHFAMDMLLAQGYVLAWLSQQAVTNMLLADARTRYGLDVRILPGELAPSGLHFHHRPDMVTSWLHGRDLPDVFHMCWTKDGPTKVVELKGVGWWFVRDQCGQGGAEREGWAADSCCTAGTMANASGDERAANYRATVQRLRQQRDEANRNRRDELSKRRARLSGPPPPRTPSGYKCVPGQLGSARKMVAGVVELEGCHEACQKESWCASFDSTSISKADSCRLGASKAVKKGLEKAGGDLREVCTYK